MEKKVKKEDMPDLVGEPVRVGSEFGRVRLGYSGPHTNAGNFEVEMTGGEPRLVRWGEVAPMTWEERKENPVPAALAPYAPSFL